MHMWAGSGRQALHSEWNVNWTVEQGRVPFFRERVLGGQRNQVVKLASGGRGTRMSYCEVLVLLERINTTRFLSSFCRTSGERMFSRKKNKMEFPENCCWLKKKTKNTIRLGCVESWEGDGEGSVMIGCRKQPTKKADCQITSKKKKRGREGFRFLLFKYA